VLKNKLPIGLWTEGLVRKPAYTAVADGLEEAEQ